MEKRPFFVETSRDPEKLTMRRAEKESANPLDEKKPAAKVFKKLCFFVSSSFCTIEKRLTDFGDFCGSMGGAGEARPGTVPLPSSFIAPPPPSLFVVVVVSLPETFTDERCPGRKKPSFSPRSPEARTDAPPRFGVVGVDPPRGELTEDVLEEEELLFGERTAFFRKGFFLEQKKKKKNTRKIGSLRVIALYRATKFLLTLWIGFPQLRPTRSLPCAACRS
jgi:hypothetical protein